MCYKNKFDNVFGIVFANIFLYYYYRKFVCGYFLHTNTLNCTWNYSSFESRLSDTKAPNVYEPPRLAPQLKLVDLLPIVVHNFMDEVVIDKEGLIGIPVELLLKKKTQLVENLY